jgi:hypothetical protein
MSKNTLLSELINYISANSSGNVVVAAPSSGLALDVSGTGRFTGALTLGSTITNGTFTYTLPSATGTLALTSSLGSYLPLSGGTLTGALGGTSATFSGNVRINAPVNGTNKLIFGIAGTDYYTLEYNDSTGNINYQSKYNHIFSGGVAGTTTILTLANTGAATFSSSVTASTLALSGGTGGINFTSSTTITNTASSGFTAIYANGGGIYLGGSASVNHLSVLGNGNVGIGTTAPSYMLDVVKAGTNTIRVYNSASSTDAYLQTQNTAGTGLFGINATGPYIYTPDALAIQFWTSGSERMRITSGGFLGLNQTSPSQRLDVSGAIRSGVGVSNGASIAKAIGRTLYKVMVSSNYDAGGAVRGGEWNVLLSNEGDAVTNTTQIYVYNNQTATFSVSGGNLIINGLNSGNTICAVYTD